MIWAYRKGPRGRFEGAIFSDEKDIPAGWVDTPAALKGWECGKSGVVKIDPPKKVEKHDDGE